MINKEINYMEKILYSIICFLFVASANAQDINHQYDILLSKVQTKYVFRGEKASRAYNIEFAATKIKELIISPQETVSYNTMIGPRNYSNGFRKAPIIINGELEDGPGGGVCQVSGTLHAAAFLAGLEIIESTQHSRTSTYIEPGLDSTVVWPIKDLKIKNTYDFPIKVIVTTHRDMDIKRGILTIMIFGKEKIYDIEHQTIIYSKSKVTIIKKLLLDKPKTYRKVIEPGSPAMDILRIRRIYRYKTKILLLQEEKRIRYTSSKRIIELGIL